MAKVTSDASLERILTDPTESFTWRQHDFPCDLARWAYHPECEVHLICNSSGTAFVGDYIGHFGPGHLALVGPSIPHHWVSALAPGEVVRGRDIVLQFDPSLLERAAGIFPELGRVRELLALAQRGIEFHGETAVRARDLLERIGLEAGPRRVSLFMELMRELAFSTERVQLASFGYRPTLERDESKVVEEVMTYILNNLSSLLRMSQAAKLVNMSEPAFSRFFKRQAGNTFVDYVRKLRVSAACRLLVETERPITDVCYEVGYGSQPTFNRQFFLEKRMTPSTYRRLARLRVAEKRLPK